MKLINLRINCDLFLKRKKYLYFLWIHSKSHVFCLFLLALLPKEVGIFQKKQKQICCLSKHKYKSSILEREQSSYKKRENRLAFLQSLRSSILPLPFSWLRNVPIDLQEVFLRYSKQRNLYELLFFQISSNRKLNLSNSKQIRFARNLNLDAEILTQKLEQSLLLPGKETLLSKIFLVLPFLLSFSRLFNSSHYTPLSALNHPLFALKGASYV